MLAPKLYFAYLSHVFLGGLDDLVVDDPLRLAVEERGGGVDRGDLAVHQGAVTLLQRVTYLPRILDTEGWPVSRIFRHSVVGPHPPPPSLRTFLCFELEQIRGHFSS